MPKEGTSLSPNSDPTASSPGQPLHGHETIGGHGLELGIAGKVE
jgi:hypothetical protein